MKKNDIILIAALLLIAFAVFVGVSIYSKLTTKEPEAVVYLDGEEQGRYPLSEDTEVELRQTTLESGQDEDRYNILRIHDGKADIVEASCPDKVCVNHRPVNGNGESLVCLPNQMVVEIENGVESEIDAGTN